MNPLLEAINKVYQGYQFKSFQKRNKPYLEKQHHLSEWGDPNDPNQYFTGRYGDDGEEIWSGGSAASTRIKSETTSLQEQGGQLTDEELQSTGINPNRRGNFDPYEGFENQPVYQYENRIPSIGNVGVWGADGGTFGANNAYHQKEGINQDFLDRVESINQRGDRLYSTNNYFNSVMNPYGEDPIKYTQLGRGRGATYSLDMGSRGGGTDEGVNFLGLNIPYGTYRPPK